MDDRLSLSMVYRNKDCVRALPLVMMMVFIIIIIVFSVA